MARATGEYVVFLDADDRFEPTRLERLGALATERPDLDILTTDAYIEVEGSIVRRYYTATNRFVIADQRAGILSANFLFGLLAVRRSTIVGAGGFDESVPVVEDWECWMRLILGGARVGLVDEPLAVYRVRPGSGSSDRVRLMQGRIDALGRALARTDLSGEERRLANDAIAFATRMLTLAEAQRALTDGAPDARSRSLRVVTGRGSHGEVAPRRSSEWSPPGRRGSVSGSGALGCRQIRPPCSPSESEPTEARRARLARGVITGEELPHKAQSAVLRPDAHPSQAQEVGTGPVAARRGGEPGDESGVIGLAHDGHVDERRVDTRWRQPGGPGGPQGLL